MTKEQRPPILLMTDADGLAENTRPCFVVLSISRREIESGNWASALERLLVLIDTAANAQLYRECLILEVKEYDDDTRELAEIPEVREYFGHLSRAWPHWLWFLYRPGGAVSLLMSLLCPVKIHREAGRFGVEFTDVDQFTSVLTDLLERTSAMCGAFDIPMADFQASMDSAIENLHAA